MARPVTPLCDSRTSNTSGGIYFFLSPQLCVRAPHLVEERGTLRLGCDLVGLGEDGVRARGCLPGGGPSLFMRKSAAGVLTQIQNKLAWQTSLATRWAPPMKGGTPQRRLPMRTRPRPRPNRAQVPASGGGGAVGGGEFTLTGTGRTTVRVTVKVAAAVLRTRAPGPSPTTGPAAHRARMRGRRRHPFMRRQGGKHVTRGLLFFGISAGHGGVQPGAGVAPAAVGGG
jgi:hypothetical protein